MALPLARVTIQREKEQRLRALWTMHDAIGWYKDAADGGRFQTRVDTNGYHPDLDTLVKGVEVLHAKRMRFLRSISIDHMPNSADWVCGRCRTIQTRFDGKITSTASDVVEKSAQVAKVSGRELNPSFSAKFLD